ncbi:hypothetical protein [Arthrobacter sp. AL12]|uniref:hypothetical protein n=1 Tax=Arthrobacter sp. AL12 TaxID=3042241 RepID=UPI00249B9082|nr:hypothetical protein [Arthrobacter sp. AL12]MDI3212241.1 hypothetical protein [Arthrobacter sp. AL12]
MQQQPASTPGGGPATAPAEFYLPRGGTDPDFHFPADRGLRPGRVSRWMSRLVAARSRSLPAAAPNSGAPQ